MRLIAKEEKILKDYQELYSLASSEMSSLEHPSSSQGEVAPDRSSPGSQFAEDRVANPHLPDPPIPYHQNPGLSAATAVRLELLEKQILRLDLNASMSTRLTQDYVSLLRCRNHVQIPEPYSTLVSSLLPMSSIPAWNKPAATTDLFGRPV